MKFSSALLMAVSFIFIASYVSGDSKKQVTAVVSDGVQKVEVVATEYSFDPDYIIVKVNVPVEIQIRKEPGIVPHNFEIKAPEAGINIHEKLSSKPKVIRFTPEKTGKYEFYCDKSLLFFGNHKDKGMKGILEVRQ